jgi:hypothetical protein
VCACICITNAFFSNVIYSFGLYLFSFFVALRESPVKRRSRLSKMVPGPEQDKEIIATPLAIRSDRGGLHTSPTERRSYDVTPFHSNQSDNT